MVERTTDKCISCKFDSCQYHHTINKENNIKYFFTSLLIAATTSMLYYIGVHQEVTWVGYIFWGLFYGVLGLGLLLNILITLLSNGPDGLLKLSEYVSTSFLDLKGNFITDVVFKPYVYLVLYTLYTYDHTTALIFLVCSSVLIKALSSTLKRNVSKHFKLKDHITSQLK